MLWKRVNKDWLYWYQCVDLMRDYIDHAKYPETKNRWNAIDLWDKWLWTNYIRVNNSIFAKPPIGAIVFWKQWKYGHVAISWWSNLLWQEVLEQNGWNGGWDGKWKNAIRLRKDFYHNCLGWFLPKE